MFLCNIGKGLDYLYKLSGALAALCLVSMAVCVVTSIVSRLVGVYVPGLTEIAGFLMAAANCLALAYTFRGKAHIQVTLFIEKMGVRKQQWWALFALLVTSVVCVYLAYYMCRLVYFSWQYGDVSGGSVAILMWIPQSVVSLGCIFFAVSVVHSFFECLWFTVTGREVSPLMRQETEEVV